MRSFEEFFRRCSELKRQVMAERREYMNFRCDFWANMFRHIHKLAVTVVLVKAIPVLWIRLVDPCIELLSVRQASAIDKNRSRRPSLSKSNTATPDLMVSMINFSGVRLDL